MILHGHEIDKFTEAYLVCALWSSHDESTPDGGEPMDLSYDLDDFATEAVASMVEDCRQFQANNEKLLSIWYGRCRESVDRAGHDFWLTRNGHGAGYWDRWSGGFGGKVGEKLTDAADVFGSCDLYVGDDGKVYCQ